MTDSVGKRFSSLKGEYFVVTFGPREKTPCKVEVGNGSVKIFVEGTNDGDFVQNRSMADDAPPFLFQREILQETAIMQLNSFALSSEYKWCV